MQKHRYTETAAKIFCIVAALFFIWFLFEYTLAILLPFAIGFAIGVPIHLLSRRICRHSRIHPKLCSLILLLAFLILLSFAIFKGINRLLFEVESLIISLQSEDSGHIAHLTSISESIKNISQKIPFIGQLERIEGLEGIGDAINQRISEYIDSSLSKLADTLPSLGLKIAKSAPRLLIGVIVTALSCFYFATDYSGIKEGALGVLSPTARERSTRLFSLCAESLKKYLRAYLVIMVITFAEVFVGLLILGVPYAFLIAFAVAFVDLLPIFGAGTVLLPWAIVCFIIKDVGTATGLLVLYAVVTIVRQVIEPKIIGSSLGIHPLITLFAMVAALELFGIAGMVLSPFILIIIKESLTSEAL